MSLTSTERSLFVFPATLCAAFFIFMDVTAAGGREFKWIDMPPTHVELRFGDRPVLRYMYESYNDSTPEDRERTYKVYHHVFNPDGSEILTKGPGGLYPHHRGLFYGFSKTRYGDGQVCDTWHSQGNVHQSHVGVLSQTADSDQASHRLAIDWHGLDGEVIAREQRVLAVYNRPAGTLIEFTSSLKPAGEKPLHLDGDPQHAGFQFRASQEVAADTKDLTYYLRTDGKGQLGETRNWNPADSEDPINPECTNRPWNAMSFVVERVRYTAVYLDHPENPKPGRYSERDYGRFGSYFVAEATAEKSLEIRYRIWVQEGEMTVDQCTALADQFVMPAK